MITFVSIPTALLVDKITSDLFFLSFSLIIAIFLFVRSYRKESLLWVMTLTGTAVMVFLLKEFFAIPRPTGGYLEFTGYAFPSGHGAMSMSVALFLSWIIERRAQLTPTKLRNRQVTFFVIAVMIGFSRISLGAHTPFQVFAGFALGLTVTSLILFFFYKK